MENLKYKIQERKLAESYNDFLNQETLDKIVIIQKQINDLTKLTERRNNLVNMQLTIATIADEYLKLEAARSFNLPDITKNQFVRKLLIKGLECELKDIEKEIDILTDDLKCLSVKKTQ